MINPKNDLTEGNIYSTVVMFAVPYLLSNLLQALYGAVDLLIVGWFSDTAGISAVSTGSQVMQMVVSVIGGFSMGGTVLVGHYYGAKMEAELVRTAETLLKLFLITALIPGMLLMVFSKQVSLLMQAPSEALGQTAAYIGICATGSVFIFGYNAISAMLRGVGDSKSPLVFIGISCAFNIIGDGILVGIFHMGAAGAALATVISQGISMVLALLWIRQQNTLFNFNWRRLKIDKVQALKLIRLGLPISLQESLVMFSFLLIMVIVNRMGVSASAAVGVVERILTFMMLPPIAFSCAITAIVAQNMGAGRPNRAYEAMAIATKLSLAFGVFAFTALECFPGRAMEIFTTDPSVIRDGISYLRFFSIDCVLVCFVFCTNGFLNGCGKTTFTMSNNLLATFGIRIPVAYLCSGILHAGILGIGAAAPLASLFSIILSAVYIRKGKWDSDIG